MTKKVDVTLVDRSGAGTGQAKCRVAQLGNQTSKLEEHKIDNVTRGEVVDWVFTNNSQREVMRVGVDNFRTSQRFIDSISNPTKRLAVASQDVENPFDGGCSQTVAIQPGSTGVLSCRVKRDAKRPRTYKYDIIDKSNKQVILDPEIEIEE